MRSTKPPGSIAMRSRRSSHDRPDSPATAPVRVRLEEPSLRHSARFLEAVRRSRKLHGRWAHPPATADEYRAFLRRIRSPAHLCHFVCIEDDGLAGMINITEVVRGQFGSGYLGYYALAPHNGRGYMRSGLEAVIRRAFTSYKLHRLEANIQPGNERSIALVQSLGFRREGYSPRYLKLGGRWRDHERWAMTVEDWKSRLRRTADRRARDRSSDT